MDLSPSIDLDKKERKKRYDAERYAANKAAMKQLRKDWQANNRAKANQYSVAWRTRNKEKVKEYRDAWRARSTEQIERQRVAWLAKNADKLREKRAIYYEANKERLKRQSAEWARKNPGLVASYSSKHRAAKLRATPPWIDMDEIAAIYQRAAEMGMTVDHIYPLQHPLCCGLHVPWNLQIISFSENARKGNKLPC